jgi:YebC/PmpR family DNA-binding regulatory protein
MSGHSKWNNIKHKKEKADAAKAKIFTKIGKEMAVAIRAGGPNPDNNSKLRELIAKAKANNVPNDNIDRAIKKFRDSDVVYEEITYEGYGPSGVAVIVETATDNRNRTAAEVRHFFDKYGGNMGTSGCVGYLFSDKGVIVVENDGSVDEDKLMEDSLEAGAEDFVAEEEAFEIYTTVDDLSAIRADLESKGYKIASADKDKIPSNYITLENEDDIKNMNLLLEKLEENDDVQNVYHNWENCEE